MSNKEVASITLYDITKCGLYKFNDSSTPILGNTEIFLDQLIKWAKNPKRNLIDTCTYEIDDDELGERTFCYDIIKNPSTKNFLVVTWNETSDLEGKLAAISGNVPVGQAKIKTKGAGKNEIIGFPSYFYVMPNESILATVTFGKTKNGAFNFKCYFKEFISKYTSYACYEQNTETQTNELKGYKKTKSSRDDPQNLRAMFNFNIIRSSHQIDKLIADHKKITKVVKHNKLSVADTLKLGWSSKLSISIFDKQKPKIDGDVKFTFEYPYTPTNAKELRDFIKDWELNYTGSMWDNIGFKLHGESQTIWLNDMNARNKFDLFLSRNKQNIIDPIALFSELERISSNILLLK